MGRDIIRAEGRVYDDLDSNLSIGDSDFIFASGDGSLIAHGGGGDFIRGGGVSDQLWDDLLVGRMSGDALYGGDGNDYRDGGHALRIEDGTPQGIVSFDLTADTLMGGADNDTYVSDNIQDVIVEAAGQGVDTILTGLNLVLSAGGEIENAQATALTGIKLTGNALANALIGNIGNDTLFGGAGKDVLTGGFGRTCSSLTLSQTRTRMSIGSLIST